MYACVSHLLYHWHPQQTDSFILPHSMDVFHNPKHISSFLTQSWWITNRSCAWGLAGLHWWELHMQYVWRWRGDESQTVVRNRRRTQLTMQLWEPPLTIWWHLVELLVSITLFNFIYACLRKKYVYVYSPNGIWICAMDKYLQPRWKVIHQVYDGFSGWDELDWMSWWDFLNRIVHEKEFI